MISLGFAGIILAAATAIAAVGALFLWRALSILGRAEQAYAAARAAAADAAVWAELAEATRQTER